MRRALVILLLLLYHAAAAESLGRLFYTPQEREALEAQRQAGAVAADAPPGNQVTLNGTVRRSGGKNTVWLNHAPRYEREGGLSAVGKNGQALVRLPEMGSVALKVGQTLDLSTGKITEGYQRVAPSEGLTASAKTPSSGFHTWPGQDPGRTNAAIDGDAVPPLARTSPED
jgi:hypothetical protein